MRCIYGIGTSWSGANANPSSASLMSPSDSAGLEVLAVFRPRRPPEVARPFLGAAGEISAVAHAEQQRALRPVDVFVQFARRVDDEGAGRYRDGLARRPHRAAAFVAEIDLGA